MPKSKVSIVKVLDYESEKIRKALKTSLDLIGGLENILKSRRKVFVKINHLSPPSPPERGIVTHPVFTKEVLLLLREFNCDITVGDDIQSKTKDGFLISGYRQLCNELGVRLVNLKEYGFQEITCVGQVLKKSYVSPLVLESDFIINLPKLKTHSFTVFTGAVKNMFGIIPFGLRLDYHLQYYLPDAFSRMLIDIFSVARPQLNIMDGIVAMEGEGPSAGVPRKTGILLASQDAVALDAVATKIIGFNPLDIYTTLHADENGVGIGRLEDIEIAGERIKDVEIKDFVHSSIAVGLFRRKIPQFLYAYLQSQLAFIPEVLTDKCTMCMECIDICPRGAVKLREENVWVEKGLCIHCMCCHEVCRFQAIKLNQRLLGRMMRGASSIYKRIKSLFS